MTRQRLDAGASHDVRLAHREAVQGDGYAVDQKQGVIGGGQLDLLAFGESSMHDPAT